MVNNSSPIISTERCTRNSINGFIESHCLRTSCVYPLRHSEVVTDAICYQALKIFTDAETELTITMVSERAYCHSIRFRIHIGDDTREEISMTFTL
jgi:hypothetical protein